MFWFSQHGHIRFVTRGTRSGLGSFPSPVQLSLAVWKAEEPESKWARWQWLGVARSERRFQEKGNGETARSCAYLSTYEQLPTTLPLRSAGSRLLGKVRLLNTAAAASGSSRCHQCFMRVRVWQRFQGRSSTSARETWTNENWVSFALLCDAAVSVFVLWTWDRWEIKPHMTNNFFLSNCNNGICCYCCCCLLLLLKSEIC